MHRCPCFSQYPSPGSFCGFSSRLHAACSHAGHQVVAVRVEPSSAAFAVGPHAKHWQSQASSQRGRQSFRCQCDRCVTWYCCQSPGAVASRLGLQESLFVLWAARSYLVLQEVLLSRLCGVVLPPVSPLSRVRFFLCRFWWSGSFCQSHTTRREGVFELSYGWHANRAFGAADGPVRVTPFSKAELCFLISLQMSFLHVARKRKVLSAFQTGL